MSTSAQNLEVPTQAAPKAVVALLNVADVERSISFYEKLGFEVGNEPLADEQGVKKFVWMHRGNAAQIMLSRVEEPSNFGIRNVMFYLYSSDMLAYRKELIARGVTVGEISYPFWSPNGEFPIYDPDAWVWIVC